MSFARRFSPKSNRCEVSSENQIDLLISTDALSEGVNLQDADTLINYDIHWNPVRLIQRAGRIDRIGSENETINIASFLPEAGLESALGLEAVLRRRIHEFLTVFGEDSHVLPSDDKLDPTAAAAAFTGEALEAGDDDMDGLSRHVERLLQLRREQPSEYGRILEIRPGRHAASIGSIPGTVVARLGWFWRFWTRDQHGETAAIDDLRGLDALFAHSEAGEAGNPTIETRQVLSRLIDHARAEFEPLAASFREQRLRPRMTPPETFVLERLESYKRVCIASRRAHVDELIAWVRGGYGQIQLRRVGRIWKREALPAEVVFNETRVLFSRFPAVHEELGHTEVVGAVIGLPIGS